MSGGFSAAFAAFTAYNVYANERQMSAQRSAQAKAEEAAQQQRQDAQKVQTASEEATNKANQKRPDRSGLLDAAMKAGEGGQSSTMLTGTQGVDKNTLQLGKNTLLGG